MTPGRDPRKWATLLRQIAGPTASEAIPIDRDPDRTAHAIASFRDERGHRRACDAPFLAHVLGVPAPARPNAALTSDVELWWALHGAGAPIDRLVGPGPGPLLGAPPDAIEVRTEAELSALHALWWHARHDARWRDRCLGAASWHADNLQPDNATNHPWGLHVFVVASAVLDDPGLLIHAETLLHNAMVGAGRPDRFSAFVLLDSAAALELEAAQTG